MRQANSGEDRLADRGAEPPHRRAQLESVVDDVVGVDFKLPRTLVDTLIRPGRVADAALANDHTRYTRPLRVFLALLAVLAIIYGWIGIYDAGSLASITTNPAQLADLEARLAEAGATLEQADEVASRWLSWSIGPVTAITSLISMLVIWATRPSLGPFKALALYLVATNASALIALPLIVGSAFGGMSLAMLGSTLSFFAFIVYAGLVLHKRAADTTAGLVWRLVALTAATIPIVILLMILTFAISELGFRLEIGVWRVGLILEMQSAAQGSAPDALTRDRP